MTLEAVLFRSLDTTSKIVMHKNRYFLCCKLQIRQRYRPLEHKFIKIAFIHFTYS